MKFYIESLLYAVVVSSTCARLIDNYNDEFCNPSITTVSGDYAPQGPLCRGQLIFNEEFDDYLDTDLWTHEQRLSPVSVFEGISVCLLIVLLFKKNGEFQWYVNDTENSYINNGKLVIMPTLTTDLIPDLTNCFINISTE